jgi:hypothetical protein
MKKAINMAVITTHSSHIINSRPSDISTSYQSFRH